MPKGHYPIELRDRGVWDPAPLLDYATRLGWDDEEMSRACGVSSRQIIRYRNGSLMKDVTADKAAVALGFTPDVFWPDWFDVVDWSGLEAEEAAEAAALEAEVVTLEQLELELVA